MNDCLGKHGSHPEYCYKCLVSEKCIDLSNEAIAKTEIEDTGNGIWKEIKE